jgi:hypothetical protein
MTTEHKPKCFDLQIGREMVTFHEPLDMRANDVITLTLQTSEESRIVRVELNGELVDPSKYTISSMVAR